MQTITRDKKAGRKYVKKQALSFPSSPKMQKCHTEKRVAPRGVKL